MNSSSATGTITSTTTSDINKVEVLSDVKPNPVLENDLSALLEANAKRREATQEMIRKLKENRENLEKLQEDNKGKAISPEATSATTSNVTINIPTTDLNTLSNRVQTPNAENTVAQDEIRNSSVQQSAVLIAINATMAAVQERTARDLASAGILVTETPQATERYRALKKRTADYVNSFSTQRLAGIIGGTIAASYILYYTLRYREVPFGIGSAISAMRSVANNTPSTAGSVVNDFNINIPSATSLPSTNPLSNTPLPVWSYMVENSSIIAMTVGITLTILKIMPK